MQSLRKIMGWIFGISSLLCILGTYIILHKTIQALQQQNFALWKFRIWLLILLFNTICPAFAIIFGVAWWTNWREKLSARRCGIAASLTFVLYSLWVFFNSSKSDWGIPGVELSIGVIGLIVFLRRYKIKPKTNDSDPGNNLS
jgi:hypothetical protein